MSEIRNDEVGIYLARELETILSRTYEVSYSDIVYQNLIPVSQEVGEAAESYTYRIFDAQGSMKIIQDKASDLPRSDVLRKEVTAKVVTIGGSFAYTVAETRAAATIPGMNLEQRRANAVRRSSEEKIQDIAFFGDSSVGLEGFFNSAQIDKVVPNKWFTDSATTTDEMIDLLNEPATRIVSNSRQKERPNTLLLPLDAYRKISTTPRSSSSDTTVLEFFLRTNPYIRSVEPINELAAANGSLSKDRMIAYDRSPDKLQLHLPKTLEFLPPIRQGLEFSVAAMAKVGGVSLYYPKSAIVLEKA